MDIWNSLGGMVELELTSADPAGALRAINSAGITLYKTRQEGDLTLVFHLRRRDLRRLRALAEKRGERLLFTHRRGIYWTLRQLPKRPILLLGMAFILGLTLYLPTRVLFVEVEGNHAIPTRKILQQAETCGIGFGATRREVRSERMKNALLSAIPDLQWAGINTYGCRAVISVRERTESEKVVPETGVNSIIAARDGVIREITVLKGNPACKVGQAVKAGQVLISGYTDLGICIRADHAQGEVFAETSRELTAILPANYTQKTAETHRTKKYSLILKNKHIKFFKGSGISDPTCVKMYSVNYMTLPGGFQLPIALVTEEWVSYEQAPVDADEETAKNILQDFSGNYLTGTMTAGQIQARYETVALTGEIYRQYGQYACLEMIGKSRLEENTHNYGENNRADS